MMGRGRAAVTHSVVPTLGKLPRTTSAGGSLVVRLAPPRVDPRRAFHRAPHSLEALLALPSGIQLHRLVEARFANPPESHLALLVRLVAQLFSPIARDLVRPCQSPVIRADLVAPMEPRHDGRAAHRGERDRDRAQCAREQPHGPPPASPRERRDGQSGDRRRSLGLEAGGERLPACAQRLRILAVSRELAIEFFVPERPDALGFLCQRHLLQSVPCLVGGRLSFMAHDAASSCSARSMSACTRRATRLRALRTVSMSAAACSACSSAPCTPSISRRAMLCASGSSARSSSNSS